jgi:hypothetical protein
MQLITFGPDREWWVPGRVWDRLFSAVEEQSSSTPEEVMYWFRVTDANNGIDLDEDLEPGLRGPFVTTLGRVAEREHALVAEIDVNDGEDGMYRSALERLLELIANESEGGDRSETRDE